MQKKGNAIGAIKKQQIQDNKRTIWIVILIYFTAHMPIKGQESKKYFYTGKKYGSEAMFNPLNHILNESYDIIQINSLNKNFRNIISTDYSYAIGSVFRNLSNPLQNISEYGKNHFINEQLIPNTTDFQWLPNYSLHVFGGGMNYAILREWYEHQGLSMPGLFSFATVMAGHLGNEIIESLYYENYRNNVDAIADVYLFDIAGIFIFSFNPIKKFFGEKLQMTDWSSQPTITVNDFSLQNHGKYYALKIPFPLFKKLCLFTHLGIGNIIGLSYKTDQEHSFSLGVGTKMKQITGLGSDISYRTALRLGIFYDKNNSLLASLIVNNEDFNFCNLNIYPGLFKSRKISPGFWSVVSKQGKVSLGVSTRLGFGLGYN